MAVVFQGNGTTELYGRLDQAGTSPGMQTEPVDDFDFPF
ncbi:uncharacterized protein METZ01_LOCUS86195 [marine metagenome]|uniref:Uncharacterized protein n=1 Tax=marine metagenome TaxID=408172 RepID=A0A381V048_9ZZZZ